MMIASLFTSGLQFTYEEKLFTDYAIHPQELVGFEGVYGLVISTIFITIFNYIPCNLGVSSCVYTHEGFGYIESWSIYFEQTFKSPLLIVFTILWILMVAVYNPVSLTITKYLDAVARAIADVSQTIFIWVIGFIVTLTLGKKY